MSSSPRPWSFPTVRTRLARSWMRWRRSRKQKALERTQAQLLVLAEREALLAQWLLTQGLKAEALRLQMQLTLQELTLQKLERQVTEEQMQPETLPLPPPEESPLPELHFPTEEQPPPPPAVDQVWESLKRATSSPSSGS